MTAGPEWWVPVAALLAGVVLVGSAGAVVFKWAGWFDRWMRWMHTTNDLLDSLPARLDSQDRILSELRPNGGGTMADTVARVEARQVSMHGTQKSIEAKQVALDQKAASMAEQFLRFARDSTDDRLGIHEQISELSGQFQAVALAAAVGRNLAHDQLADFAHEAREREMTNQNGDLP